MSYIRTFFIGLFFTFIGVSPCKATNDAIMTTLRGAIIIQQLLEYFQMSLSYQQDYNRMKTIGEASNVKNITGNLGRTVDPQKAKPIVLSELKNSASKGIEGRKSVSKETEKLITVDTSSPESFEKSKDASNAILHISALDSYSKALQVKAAASNDGIDELDKKVAQGTENFQEKSSGFMLYVSAIAQKLNSINRLDAQISTINAALKLSNIVGEKISVEQFPLQQDDEQKENQQETTEQNADNQQENQQETTEQDTDNQQKITEQETVRQGSKT